MCNVAHNKTHTHGYPPEPNPIWRIFPVLTGFGFSPISKHGYGTGNGYIGTHPKLIPEPVPNAENYFMLICHVILFDNCRVIKIPLIFKGATKSIGVTNVKVIILLDNALLHFSKGCKKLLFFIKINYSMRGRRWGEDTWIRQRRGWGSTSHPCWVRVE